MYCIRGLGNVPAATSSLARTFVAMQRFTATRSLSSSTSALLAFPKHSRSCSTLLPLSKEVPLWNTASFTLSRLTRHQCRTFADERSIPIEQGPTEQQEDVVGDLDPHTEVQGDGKVGDQTSRPREPSNRLYIGNIPWKYDEEALREHFSPFGNVDMVDVVRYPNRVSKGYAFVTFDTMEAASAAREQMDGSDLEGRTIRCDYAVSRAQGQPEIAIYYSRRAASAEPKHAPSDTVFVGNLSYAISEADLNQLFARLKHVRFIRVAFDRNTGRGKGYAHVEFESVEAAKIGIKQLRDVPIRNRHTYVDFAAARPGKEAAPEAAPVDTADP